MNVFVAKNYLFYIEKVQANEKRKKQIRCFEKMRFRNNYIDKNKEKDWVFFFRQEKH